MNNPETNKPHAVGEAVVTYLEPALWRQLSDAESDADFCFAWLQLQCRMIQGVHSGVVFLESSTDESYVPVAYWPQSFSFHEQFSTVVDRLLVEQKGVVLRSSVASSEQEGQTVDRYHLAYPIQLHTHVVGLVALEVSSRPASELQSAMRQLQWGISWLRNRFLTQQLTPDVTVSERLMSVFDIASLTLQETTFQGAATKMVTELATRLQCDRVSSGFVKRGQIRIAALSHSAKFEKHTNLVQAIGKSMDECLDQGETLVYPAREGVPDTLLLSHAELAQFHGNNCVCTVPCLNADDEAYGAITLERAGDTPFTQDEIVMCEAVAALVGPSLEDKRRNDRFLPVIIVDSLGAFGARVFGPGHLSLKAGLVLLAAVVLFFSFYSSDYRIAASVTLEGTVQRAITVPFDGFLETSSFRAGDIVKEGDILATLNARDLVLEQIRISSEEGQRLLEYNKALAENQIALSAIILEQIKQSQARVTLLREQIERSRIRAPFKGIIISGDLDQSVGTPLKRGDVLFALAPLNSYRVIVEIDEKDIEQVAGGHNGELILNSLPDVKFPFTIDKITPVSISREGRNFFEAEGHLLEGSERLRPGMQGYGKIFIDQRKLIWIWTHNLIDWMRLWVWSWLP